jgi:endoglycosylceramidase
MRLLTAIACACVAACFFWPAAGANGSLLPLHVAREGKPRIVDAGGRQVLLRGVNSNQLGDYYRVRRDLRPTIPLHERDFQGMAEMGFNVVRLVVSWSRLEPVPGAFSHAYLKEIRRAIRWAASRHIYVVVDMHQDAWGKFIRTPRDVQCPPGTVPNQGFDGAPRWATIIDDASTCREKDGPKGNSEAVSRAWGSFWIDTEGIQDRLIATWGRLAGALAANPAVAGYDLMNEPNAGDARPLGEPTILGSYYAEAIAVIRQAEDLREGGFRHLVFFEPTILWPRHGSEKHVPVPGFSTDRDLVFAPHIYGKSSRRRGRTQRDTIRRKFKQATRQARIYRMPVWVGEWGFFLSPEADRSRFADFARRLDNTLWGDALWLWKKACGDPANFTDGSDRKPPHYVIGNLNPVLCPGGERFPTPPLIRHIVSRPYPIAAPGTLRYLRSDPKPASFEVRGVDPRAKGSPWLRIWIPARGHRRPRLRGKHVRKLHLAPTDGGWIGIARVRGRYQVSGLYPPPKRRHHHRHR